MRVPYETCTASEMIRSSRLSPGAWYSNRQVLASPRLLCNTSLAVSFPQVARVSAVKRSAVEKKAAEREAAAAAAAAARAALPGVDIPEGASPALIRALTKKAKLAAKKGAIQVRHRQSDTLNLKH